MVFYRIESYQFPHVEATSYFEATSSGKSNKGLALRFYGAKRPDVCLYFNLIDINETIVEEGSFFGSLTNEEN